MQFKPSEVSTMPAGEYFICDPCYVIPDVDWDRFCQEVPEDTVGTFTLSSGEEILVWYNSTMYGDGTYTANSYFGTFEVNVDSGAIGAIQKFGNDKDHEDILVTQLKRKFSVSVDEYTGMFSIGPWDIATGDPEFELEEWSWGGDVDDENEIDD